MIVTILWALGFLIGLILTLFFLMLYLLLRLTLGKFKADKIIYIFTKLWAKTVILSTGSKVEVIGRENLVKSEKVCFISNHQSMFDIPLLMGWLGRPVGFVAKIELKKIPILSQWIMVINSVFIDRTNSRAAITSIDKGIKNIQKGYPVAIFPEGTRSKDGKVGEFKKGSIKLATGAMAVIQPITIHGTWQMFEAKKRIQKSYIRIYIHKAISPELEVYNDKDKLVYELNKIIDFKVEQNL